jgi:hypothetical protein
VIEHPDIDQSQCLLDLTGEKLISRRRLGNTGRMLWARTTAAALCINAFLITSLGSAITSEHLRHVIF